MKQAKQPCQTGRSVQTRSFAANLARWRGKRKLSLKEAAQKLGSPNPHGRSGSQANASLPSPGCHCSPGCCRFPNALSFQLMWMIAKNACAGREPRRLQDGVQGLLEGGKAGGRGSQPVNSWPLSSGLGPEIIQTWHQLSVSLRHAGGPHREATSELNSVAAMKTKSVVLFCGAILAALTISINTSSAQTSAFT